MSRYLLALVVSISVFVGAGTAAAQPPLDVHWAELTPAVVLTADSFWGGRPAFDGQRIAISRPDAIDVYGWDGTTATFETSVVPTSGDATGFPDAYTMDHGRIIANARYAAGSPAVYEFTRSGTTWSQVARFQNPRAPAGDPLFSFPVLSGSRLLIGQPYVETARGAMTLIRSTDPIAWTLADSTAVVGGTNFELSGQTMAIDGDDVAVGTLRGAAGGVSQTGVVRVYHDTGSALSFLFGIDNPTPATDDQFGIALAMDSRGIYVGAHYDDTVTLDSGAVYVFNRTTGALVQTLYGTTTTAHERFGEWIAVDGDWMVVGAVGFTGVVGRIYLYRRNAAGSWVLRNQIAQFEGHVATYFGSVALSGHVVVVGAPVETVGGVTNAGRTWVGVMTEPDGGACVGNGECTHGHCVSGICCNTVCGGACDSCGAGTCVVMACPDTGVDAGTDAAMSIVDAAMDLDAGVDAGPRADVGPLPDTGPRPDAGAASSDAGVRDATNVDAGAGVPRVPLSCTCRASSPTRSGLGGTLLSLFAVGIAARRRRRAR